jgi:hypothetical protein
MDTGLTFIYTVIIVALFVWGFTELRDQIGNEIAGIKTLIRTESMRNNRKRREWEMSVNDDLTQIKADLAEAYSELKDLPAKIVELVAQIEGNAANTVDPELLADVKSSAHTLAGIVSSAVDPEPTPDPETPVDEAPVDDVDAVEDFS